LAGTRTTGVASLVVTVDGSSGFAVVAAALQLQSNVGQLMNTAGRVVSVIAQSVTFALAEMGTAIAPPGTSWNLINPSGVGGVTVEFSLECLHGYGQHS